MKRLTFFRNARVFDGSSATLVENGQVLVEGDRIAALGNGDDDSVPDGAEVIDCGGRVLMPGLIDAHVHVYAGSLDMTKVSQEPHSYLAHIAARFLRAYIDRGITTVRDVAGADIGLADAVREELLVSPRLFHGGRALSQTGGHGDPRPARSGHDHDVCLCACHANTLSIIADGVDAVRKAVREELRRGAFHIKIAASGGVASPTDPLENDQYSDAEIAVAVEEAGRAGAYVAAHCHPTAAIRRCVTLGVRSIEHGTLIDRETADLVAEKGAFVVPTMAIIFALLEDGRRLGFPPASLDKLARIGDQALGGLEIMKAAGVRMAFGTDLFGPFYDRPTSEFALRARALPAIDILRSACATGAELLQRPGELGCIAAGASADLILVDGNPLEDVTVLDRPAGSLFAIMRGGHFHHAPASTGTEQPHDV